MSKKLSLLLVVLLLIVPLTMAACGDDDKDDDNGNGDGGSVELNQTFESSSGVTVKYPEGWAAQDGDSGVEIANSEDALAALGDSEVTSVPDGTVALMIIPPMPLEMMGAEMSMADVLGMMSGEMGSDEGATVGEVQELTVNGKEAARADITDEEINSEGYMMAYKIDDNNVVIVAAVASQGDLESNEDVLLKIIESMTYEAPAADAE